MHDPKVVAHEIRRPWPRISRRNIKGPRWQIRYPRAKWWDFRPRTLMAFMHIAGHEIYFPAMVTIWHNEPHEHDALTVCKRGSHWKWHIHHWSIQVHLLQKIKRFLFERCELCGNRYPWGYAPVAHQWHQKPARWWHVEKRAYHHECSSLVHMRRMAKQDAELLTLLTATLAAASGTTEAELVDRLCGAHGSLGEFYLRHRLEGVLGYDRDDDYRLVKREPAREVAP